MIIVASSSSVSFDGEIITEPSLEFMKAIMNVNEGNCVSSN